MWENLEAQPTPLHALGTCNCIGVIHKTKNSRGFALLFVPRIGVEPI